MSIEQNEAFGKVDPVLLGRMQDVVEGAVRRTRSHLINRIGVGIPVRFSDLGYIALQDLMEQFQEEGAGVFVRFTFEPGGHPGMLAIDGALLNRIMGLLLGENPKAEPAPYVWRPPTRMDLRVAERLASDIIAGFLDSLPADAGARIRIEEVTGSSRFDLPLPGQTTLLDIPMDFGPPEDPYGVVTLAMPSAITHTLWPNFSPQREPTDKGVSRVLPLPVTVVAELGRVRMSLGQVEQLTTGDVLRIGRPGTVALTVAGRHAVVGQAGVADGARCVQVLRKAAPI